MDRPRSKDRQQRSGGAGEKIIANPNLQIIFAVSLVAVMGVASIAPAFPKMIAELHIPSTHIGLLITVFTLPGIFLAPVLGVMADRFGRKMVLVPALILFGLAGGGCLLARDFSLLLLLRFIQGIGAASLGSLNVTLIGDLFPGKQRTRAMGYNASVLSIGTASYPAIGGLLATFGWYFPFFLPLLALPLGFIVIFKLQSPAPDKPGQLAVQFKGALSSMANRQAIGLFMASVGTFMILYGPFLTYIPLMLDSRFGAPPAAIGVIFAIMSLITAIMAACLGFLSQRFSERNLLRTGFFIYAVSMASMPFIHSLWLFLLPSALYGVAHGMVIPCLQSMLAGLAPMNQRATFMSIFGMVLRLGQTLGPLVAAAVFALWGMEATFFLGCSIAAGLVVVVVGMMQRREEVA